MLKFVERLVETRMFIHKIDLRKPNQNNMAYCTPQLCRNTSNNSIFHDWIFWNCMHNRNLCSTLVTKSINSKWMRRATSPPFRAAGLLRKQKYFTHIICRIIEILNEQPIRHRLRNFANLIITLLLDAYFNCEPIWTNETHATMRCDAMWYGTICRYGLMSKLELTYQINIK